MEYTNLRLTEVGEMRMCMHKTRMMVECVNGKWRTDGLDLEEMSMYTLN